MILNVLKFVVLVLVTFFSCQIITDGKKRISYIGVLLICFSSAIVEYMEFGLSEAIVFGELIFISIHEILNSSKNKYIYAVLAPLSLLGFLLLSNISFQVIIGILILVLLLWRILQFKIDNKEMEENLRKINKSSDNNLKIIDKKIISVMIICFLIAIILGVIFYQYAPMKSLENKNGINYLTSYTYSSYIEFNNTENVICWSTFISVFPIGLFIGIYYIFKEESKHFSFIIITVLASILEIIIIISNINISFLPKYILVLGFNLIQIYMIIYIFARIEEKFFNLTKSAYITLACLVVLIFMPVYSKIKGVLLDISYMMFVLEAFIVLNYSDKRFWRLASWVFSIICFFEFISHIVVKVM